MGADHLLQANDPQWPAEARSLTRGQGPEVFLEMSGSASAIGGGFDALRNGGTAALLGLPAEPVALDLPNQIIFKGATVLGINGRIMYDTWYRAEELLISGRVDIAPLVTHELAMEEVATAFGLIERGEALKVLLRIA